MPEFPISEKLFPISGINYLPNTIDVPRFLILAFPAYPLSLATKSIPPFCHTTPDSNIESLLLMPFKKNLMSTYYVPRTILHTEIQERLPSVPRVYSSNTMIHSIRYINKLKQLWYLLFKIYYKSFLICCFFYFSRYFYCTNHWASSKQSCPEFGVLFKDYGEWCRNFLCLFWKELPNAICMMLISSFISLPGYMQQIIFLR